MGCPRHSLLCVTTFFKVTRPALQWILRPPLLSPIGAPTSPAAPGRRLWQWLMPAGVLGVPHLPVGGPSRRSRPRQVVSIALLFKCFYFVARCPLEPCASPAAGSPHSPQSREGRRELVRACSTQFQLQAVGPALGPFPDCFVPAGPSHRPPVGSGAVRPIASGPVDFCYVRLCCLEATPKLSLASRLLSLCYAFALLTPHTPSCGESTRSPW